MKRAGTWVPALAAGICLTAGLTPAQQPQEAPPPREVVVITGQVFMPKAPPNQTELEPVETFESIQAFLTTGPGKSTPAGPPAKIERSPGTAATGSYELKVKVPSNLPNPVWYIEFRDTRIAHPGLVQNVTVNRSTDPMAGGRPQVNIVQQVLFRRNGPQGYERNMAQLLTYEQLFYLGQSRGLSTAELRELYKPALELMPGPGNFTTFPEFADSSNGTRLQQQLARKRVDIFGLYEMPLPEAQPAPQPFPPIYYCPPPIYYCPAAPPRHHGLFGRRR